MGEMSFNAKTLDEAITKACVELGVTSDKITYKVTDQGSRGFLGIGARNCVISVSLNDEKKEPLKDEDIKIKNKTEIKKAEAEKAEAENISKERIKEKEYKKEKRSEVSIDKNQNRSEKRNNRNLEEKESNGSELKKSHEGKKSSAEEKEVKPVVLAEDPVERAKIFLGDIFKAMDMKIDYSGEYDADKNELTVNLSGDDMGILIGKRGQTLDSLQYLTSQVVNKHQNGYIRVKLDTENYRERRKDTLEAFAVNMAHKVKRNKRPVVLEPMNAYERRIIHAALQNEKDILTRSEGEEPYRHVVICPVKKRGSGNKQQA